MSVKHGPVTLFSEAETGKGALKFVVAEGESVAGPLLEIGNTNSRYKFPIGARQFVKDWSMEGPAHHCAIEGPIGPRSCTCGSARESDAEFRTDPVGKSLPRAASHSYYPAARCVLPRVTIIVVTQQSVRESRRLTPVPPERGEPRAGQTSACPAGLDARGDVAL